MLCDYIQLNPVRANIISAGRISFYRYSSYGWLWRKSSPPKVLVPEAALVSSGGLADNKKGWATYEHYLKWQAEDGPLGGIKPTSISSSGWSLGTNGSNRPYCAITDKQPRRGRRMQRARKRSAIHAPSRAMPPKSETNKEMLAKIENYDGLQIWRKRAYFSPSAMISMRKA